MTNGLLESGQKDKNLLGPHPNPSPKERELEDKSVEHFLLLK
jgi:hypothetical protein